MVNEKLEFVSKFKILIKTKFEIIDRIILSQRVFIL
jgi:hypothetical protein